MKKLFVTLLLALIVCLLPLSAALAEEPAGDTPDPAAEAEVEAEDVSLPYYLDGEKKVFIGFAAEIEGKMEFISLDGTKVLFATNPKSFSDVSGHWGEPYISFVAEREIFQGTGEDTFSPNSGMTRAMFATVVGRLYERSFGKIEASGEHKFTDVDYESWYGPYLDWAAEKEIITGVGDGKFEPDRQINRAEMAAVLYRLVKVIGHAPKGEWAIQLPYTDIDEIPEWASEAAMYCALHKIIEGREGGNFDGSGTATRAEASAVLERMIEAVLK